LILRKEWHVRVHIRPLLRLLAFLFLLALLAGVPLVVVAVVGVPLPSAAQLRHVWDTRRVDTDLVVRVGSTVFLVLWAWFTTTALVELRRVLPIRHDGAALAAPSDRGPGAMVRGLVRFVAVSSVGAGLVTSGLAATGHAEGRSAITHVVVRGDSYWDIAEGHLDTTLGREATNREVMDLTRELIERNAPLLGHRDRTLLVPGETVVVEPVPVVAAAPAVSGPVAAAASVDPPSTPAAPVAVPSTEAPGDAALAPTTVAPTSVVPGAAGTPAAAPPTTLVPTSVAATPAVAASAAPANAAPYGGRSPMLPGFAGALLLAGGALVTLETRRRRQWRAAAPGAVPAPPTFERARTELFLRALDPAERLMRLDVALRAAARDLAAQGASVLAASVSGAGAVSLHLRGAALPSTGHWQADIARGLWRLAAGVPVEALATDARECLMPCPALVHLGVLDDGDDFFLDLEAAGSLSLPIERGPALARVIAASLVVSPFRHGGSMRLVGMGLPPMADTSSGDVECVGDAAVAIAAARNDAALVGAWSAGTSTFALRSSGDGAEPWDPAIVIVGPDARPVPAVDDIPAGVGLAVVVVGDAPCACRLRSDGDQLVVEPLGLRFRPLDVDDEQLDAVADLIAATVDEPILETAAGPLERPRSTPADPMVWSFVEPEWDLRVRMIGQVFVESADGGVAEFERSKSLELVVWMALHRERSTRSGARTAMWEVGVRSATFANVVSEARRALGAVVRPVDGEDWIGRTLTDDLPLHPRVVTDAELLQARLEAARGASPERAIEILRPGLELVTGLPFCSPCFAWVDGEGHTSALVLLATGAAVELAQHHLALGDIDGVFWATGQGLKVLPGHEALIALRMRAHAAQGDLAGVRLEWEQYERALAADTWSPGEPSSKLVALRRDLLGGPVGARPA
jgi:hypothetical protein